jgi:hypothetical protein
VKALGWLALGIAVVVCCAIGCEDDCEHELDANGKRLVTCEVEITCGAVTQRQVQKFTTTGNPVWDRVQCQELTGTLNNYYTDCTYHYDIDAACGSAGGKKAPHDPTWIVGVTASTTSYGVDPALGIGGASPGGV